MTAAERAAFWLSLSDREWAAAIAARPVPMRLAEKFAASARPLTRRELEVLEVWADSASAREAGEVLGVTEWTVRDSLKRARRVLGVRSSREAVLVAFSRGLIRYRDPGEVVDGR